MESFNSYIISKNAIKVNLHKFTRINNSCKICAVVKADGYGIGTKNVVNQIDDKINFYAVACFVEGAQLRKITQKPILILNFVPTTTFEMCIKKNISFSICNLKELRTLCEYIEHHKKTFSVFSKNKQKINIHFAINTGMNRVGFSSLDDFSKAINLIKKYKDYVNIEGIFTHFYNASNSSDTQKQFCIFMQFIKFLSLHFDIDKIIKHASNSLAAVNNKKYNLDMVRLGILLYGSLEDRMYIKKLNLRPVLQIKSKIINIVYIKQGENVGYGTGFVAQKNMTVGTVPLGYADGIFRCYSKKGYVLCGGKRCKIVGNICMDMFMIDISKIKVKLFDEVVVIGRDKFGNMITIDDVAKNCNTISYEILTNIKQERFNVKIS